MIAKLREISIDKYRDMMQQNAGALLVLLPQDLSVLSDNDTEVGALFCSLVIFCSLFLFIYIYHGHLSGLHHILTF